MNFSPADPSRYSRRRPSLLPIALLVAVLALLAFLPARAQVEPQQADQPAAISAHLEAQLATAVEPVSFLVILEDQVDAQAVAASVTAAAPTDAVTDAALERTARAEAVYRTLTENALRSQAPIRAWLEENGVPYRAFYIANMIEVQGDAALAEALSTLPGVDRLAANPDVAGEQAVLVQPAAAWLKPLPVSGAQSTASWDPGLYGLPYTRAPEVWGLGFTGQGIVVASQDTGVQWDHPAIIGRYRGWDAAASQAAHAYNWFDAWSTPDAGDRCGPDHQIPCDDNGHGTHTVGTMLGDASNDLSNSYGVLGMAPGAQWVGCRNMRNNYGNPASYAACFQFMLAPYPQNGDPFTAGRPELAPHIINNSWSCPPTEDCDSDSLRQVVETARAAGQLVVASAGNYGPACSSVQHPIAIHDAVFSVGAHNSAGQIAGFSSRGPVLADGSGRLKPDISAPGVDVFSATSHSGYGYASGTSMSSPHVAGAAALLWSAAPDLIGNIDLTEQVLIKSATRVLDNQCLSGSAPVSPNPAYGYGRLDALSAVMMARTPWEVVVNVTNSQGAAQADVRVVLIDELTRYRFVNATNKNGVVRLPRVYDGGYTLRVGSGDQVVVKKDVELQAAGNPDAIGRSRHIDVTYPVSVSIEQLYLPRLSFQ